MVGAFHHVSAIKLWGDQEYLADEDVLVVGDSVDAKAVAIELARAVTGRDGIDSGKLRLARQLEPLTAVLISINRKYKTHSGGSAMLRSADGAIRRRAVIARFATGRAACSTGDVGRNTRPVGQCLPCQESQSAA